MGTRTSRHIGHSLLASKYQGLLANHPQGLLANKSQNKSQNNQPGTQQAYLPSKQIRAMAHHQGEMKYTLHLKGGCQKFPPGEAG